MTSILNAEFSEQNIVKHMTKRSVALIKLFVAAINEQLYLIRL